MSDRLSSSISIHTLFPSLISTAHTFYQILYLSHLKANYSTNFISGSKYTRSSKFSKTN